MEIQGSPGLHNRVQSQSGQLRGPCLKVKGGLGMQFSGRVLPDICEGLDSVLSNVTQEHEHGEMQWVLLL